MQALSNGVLCVRDNPTHYAGTSLVMPEKYRGRKDRNTWVKVVSVGPACREDIRPGDVVLIAEHMGREFEHEGKKCVFVMDKEPLCRMRNG